MADDDVDWEACGILAARPSCGVLAVRPAAKAAPQRGGWKIKLPPPRKRTREQHVLAACRMREAKAFKAAFRRADATVAAVNGTLEHYRKAGILLDSTLKLSLQHGGAIHVEASVGRRKLVAAETMLRVAFSPINTQGDLSKMFAVSTKTIARIRAVTANSGCGSDAAFMKGLASSFASCPPKVAMPQT